MKNIVNVQYFTKATTPRVLEQVKEFLPNLEGLKDESLIYFSENCIFYFLCSNSSCYQELFEKRGWYIVSQHPFNEHLTIGTGLYEDVPIVGYFHNMAEDSERLTMWLDIIKFTFLTEHQQLFLPLDSYFKGFCHINGSLCLHLYDYSPVSHREKADIGQKKTTNLLFRFKEGEAISLSVKLFSLGMKRIYAIHNIIRNAILIPIPASTEERHYKRFSTFCHLLAEKMQIENGFDAIKIKKDREQLKGFKDRDKIGNLLFHSHLYLNKHVILVDDVLNTGTGFSQLQEALIKSGAKSVTGIFLAKTIQNR